MQIFLLYTVHSRSPGYGLTLVSESTSGVTHVADLSSVSSHLPSITSTPSLASSSGSHFPPVLPEDVGRATALLLIEKIVCVSMLRKRIGDSHCVHAWMQNIIQSCTHTFMPTKLPLMFTLIMGRPMHFHVSMYMYISKIPCVQIDVRAYFFYALLSYIKVVFVYLQ